MGYKLPYTTREEIRMTAVETINMLNRGYLSIFYNIASSWLLVESGEIDRVA